MKYKKPLIAAGVSSAVAIASLAGVSGVMAATSTTSTSTSPVSGLVDKIATKFNLNKTDVQAVFDADHTEREAEMETKTTTELNQLVTDGKLTTAQKDAIAAKRAELKTQRDANRTAMDSKTDAERKAAMEAEKTALDKWATDNNISSEYLRYVFGGGRGHGGPGGPGGDMTPPADASASTSTSTSTN